MVAIGGSGTFWGPVLGALIYTAVPQLLLDYEDAELMLFGLGMLIVLIVFPRASPAFRRRCETGTAAGERGRHERGAAKDRSTELLFRRTSRRRRSRASTVAAGEIKAVIGPNGAGKSTLFNMIAGVTRATSGRILFDGHRIDTLPTFAAPASGSPAPFRICRSSAR